MPAWPVQRALLGGILSAAALLSLAVGPAHGQYQGSGVLSPYAQTCPCPAPLLPTPQPPAVAPPTTPPPTGVAPTPQPPTTTPSAPTQQPPTTTPQPPTPTQQPPTTAQPSAGAAQATTPAAEPTAPAQQAAAQGAETAAFAAPNMIGDLLLASRSINFRYNRAAGPINVANNGNTSIVNAAVADDNSPLPRDRFSFRYNHFENAQSVTGFGPPVFDPSGVGTSFAQSRDYNLERYTFQFEKTFLDGLASVEVRAPFSTTLSTHLDLSAGNITGPVLGPNGQPLTSANGPVFGVASTPEQTLGRQGTQFENMMLIFKGLAYQSQALAVSGGLAIEIPTGADTVVRVTDFSGSLGQGTASVERVREFQIANETWALSPFLAVLATPTDRFFSQGFLEFDFPLNDSHIHYSETIPRGIVPPLSPSLALVPTLTPPFATRTGISEQPLMHLDWGVGYWLLRDPSRRWLTGIAPTLELHYTTTLENASIVTLPGDPFVQINPQNPSRLIQEQPPRIGNFRNRVDILDMTVATTFQIGERFTLATGVAFPLKGGDDRTFDWEFHLQLNYFFGSTGRRFTPNF